MARSLQSDDGNTRHHLTMTKTITSPTDLVCEIKQKFVRVKEVRPDGLVCFEFAIAWPELFVDLMLPQSAFDDFCVRQQVTFLVD